VWESVLYLHPTPHTLLGQNNYLGFKLMQLRLNQQELEFLIFVDYQDDWHWSAFVDVIEDFKTMLPSDSFIKVKAELTKLNQEQMIDLQYALNILGNLGWQYEDS
jgi:hypothetical protein